MSLEEDKYQLEQEQLMQVTEQSYFNKLKTALNKVITIASNNYLLFGFNGALNEPLREEHVKDLQTIQDQNARIVIGLFSKRTADIIGVPIPDKTRYDQIFNDYASKYTLSMSKLKADTSFNEIQKAIQTAFDQNYTQEAIAKEILKVKKMSPVRARMIARTEIGNAANYATLEQAKAYEIELGLKMKKKWIAALDERTRPDHRAMISHPSIPLNELFSVGLTKMSRPNDPAGGAKQVCNCRCTLKIETEN
jgi:nicotinamide mononucleotide adenylyltransferase